LGDVAELPGFLFTRRDLNWDSPPGGARPEASLAVCVCGVAWSGPVCKDKGTKARARAKSKKREEANELPSAIKRETGRLSLF
jgi:hypothetical protein